MFYSLRRALAGVALAFCGTSLVAVAQNPLINSAPSGIATVPYQSRGSSGGLQRSSESFLSMSTEPEYDFGRTQGSFGVSPSGAATYTIPIWTPPGPNGMQPSIALTYSSQGGNGLAGVGWNLAAVSSIERCARTRHQDGNAAAVDLTTNDRLCIGGNRLRLQSGTYGAASSVYFTELADYSRISALTYSGGGTYFLVEAKSGLKYEYGNTADSRVALGGTVLRWMLSKVSDRSGNNYVIAYNNDGTGFAVPDVISWTPTYHGSASHRYEAKFNYSNTRANEDSYLGKVAGFDVANRYRLESIDIKSAGVVMRHYPLEYDTSPATSRSRLTSVKECAVDDDEDNCFLPLTFEYQAGDTGISATPVSGVSSTSSLVPGKYDFNGDGKSDLLYVSGSTWHVSFSTGSGFTSGVNTGVTSSATYHVHRFLATHQDGLLVDVSGTWNYVGYNGSSFSSTSTGASVATGTVTPTMLTDNNGDGLADLVWTVGGSVKLRLNNTSGSASVPSFDSEFTAATFSVGQGNVAIMNAQDCLTARTCDVNGDGRAELIVNVVSATNCGMGGCTIVDTKYDLFATGAGYSAGAANGAISYRGFHFNDDRCIDRVLNVAPSTLQVSGCDNAAPSTVSLPTSSGIFMDWNGDGHTDIVVNSGGYFGFYLSKGDATSPFGSLVTTTIPISSSCSYFVFDADGDGLDDLACAGTSSPFAVSYYPRAGSGGVYLTQEPDLLSSATDGFGVNDSPSYVSTSQNHYTRGTGTQLPLLDATAPITVVAQVTSSNPIGGTYTRTYSYHGARNNRERGESAGFQRFDEVDSRAGLISRTYFDQAFPIAGMVSKTELMQPNGTTTVAREVFTNNSATLADTAFNQRYFSYTSASTATQYEVGGTWNGVLLRTVTTENLFDNPTGTLYDKTVTTTEPASGANGVSGGGIWEARTYLPLAQLMEGTSTWCIGRPQQSRAINSKNQEFDDEITRTTNITWNATSCRPTQIVEEPGSGTLQVTTDIAYDDFGNVTETTVTGIGMDARTSGAVYADSTHTTGQFPISMENALEQESTLTWDYDLGVPESVTDPNGSETSWTYDAYGRKTGEMRPDGTSSSLTYADCASCGGFIKTQTVSTEFDDAHDDVVSTEIYHNAFGQEVERWHKTMTGIYSLTMTYYDALGRVALKSAPCLANGTDCNTLLWTTSDFDLLSRTTAVSRRKADDNSDWQTTYINFKGLTTEVVDPQGKVTLSIANALGQTARSQDHDGYYQHFDYDSFGNVKRVADSTGALQTSGYNLRGMLTSRTDMDMGPWGFAPNALGETVSQTDAKSQTTTFFFDKLGRLKKRIEVDGTSEWTWGVLGDNTSTSKFVGRLKEVEGPGYSETYSYDDIGRRSGTTISADGSYQIDYSYNSMGALDTLTYPESTSSFRLKLKYEYANGYLAGIKECTNSACTTFGTNYWTANTYSALGQVTQETLGNDLVTSRVYDRVTGWLKTIETGTDAEVQELEYEWDLAGNLKKRIDHKQSDLEEEFFYDNLYRLDSVKRNGVTSLSMDYDALGNITSRSDMGAYSYHSTRRHQVTGVSPLGWTFSYDDNGNMTSGRYTTIEWTSSNYAKCIRTGTDCSGTSTNWSSFSYTPDRRYWKQVSNYLVGGSATTIYVGGILEKVTTSAGTDYRHMIRAGGASIIVSRKSSGTTTRYVLTDHLGSNTVFTDSDGEPLANTSYDAFGSRRDETWASGPTSSDWETIAGTTRRGYTEHSMLDNLNLIHMNGRVYDQWLGRFISADPLISAPGYTQNYNRYSYVYNNPVTFTDPSGFIAREVRPQCKDECRARPSFTTVGGNAGSSGGRGAGGLPADSNARTPAATTPPAPPPTIPPPVAEGEDVVVSARRRCRGFNVNAGVGGAAQGMPDFERHGRMRRFKDQLSAKDSAYLGPSAGASGNVSAGLSVNLDSPLDSRFYVSGQIARLHGIGDFMGIGGQVQVAPGTIPVDLTHTRSFHLEGNYGLSAPGIRGPSLSIAVDFDSGSVSSTGGSASMKGAGGRYGWGSGAAIGAGPADTWTYGLPTISEIFDSGIDDLARAYAATHGVYLPEAGLGCQEGN